MTQWMDWSLRLKLGLQAHIKIPITNTMSEVVKLVVNFIFC